MWQASRTIKESIRKHVMAAALTIAGAPVYAQSTIDLPAQPLASTLSRLAHEAGVNILAPDDLVAGRSAPAVSGQLTVREALGRLLRGTGLQVEQRDDKTYVIVAPTPPASKPHADTVLPAIKVQDSAPAADTGFVAESTSTATRTDTPISETPQSIQVITQDVIESQQIQSVSDALARVSGVTVQNTGNGSPQVDIRGFLAPTMTNGSNDTGFSNSLTIPMAGVERVEVLKGADSILSGQMSPGGVVNVVLKQPTADPVHELTVQAGSYGDWLSAIDLGGPLTQDDRLTYRFVLSAERAGESFGGYEGGKTLYFAPSVGWKSGGTELVVAYQHQVQDEPPVPLTLVGPDGPLPLSGRPTPQANTLTQSDTLSVDLKQKLGSIFQFESKTQYQSTREDSDHVYLLLGGTTDSAVYYGLTGLERSYGLDTDNNMRAKFSIGPVKQTLLAGFDYKVYWTDENTADGVFFDSFPAPVLPPITGSSYYYDAGKQYSSNAYLQDQLSWGRLHVLASIARGTSWGSSTESQSAWSPNIGVLYQLTGSMAVYANALRSFTPQTGTFLVGGGQAPAATGRSIEAGFKFNFLDDRLNVTADVFRAAVMNQATYIPGSDLAVLEGGQVSRGAELNVAGRVTAGLKIIASYTYSDELQGSDGSSLVPRHSGSLWTTYDLQSERWHGWGAGVGIQARSGYAIEGVGYRVPGQMQTDLSVYYKTKRWSATLGVKNLFDRVLYQSQTYAEYTVPLQPGRVFTLTGRYNF